MSRVPAHITANQGELVLIDSAGQPGDSNRPCDTADTIGHGATVGIANRSATASAAAVTAATASAKADPAGSATTGSAATATSTRVNQTRNCSARPDTRRNQPRTVPNGRPAAAAIGRTPTPTAFAVNACPITATESARRSNNAAGSSTCVLAHPPQRARRGRTTSRRAPSKISLDRAQPQPVNAAAQPGQARPPAANRRSTTTGSSFTVTTRCLQAPPRGPPGTQPRNTGGPLPTQTSPR